MKFELDPLPYELTVLEPYMNWQFARRNFDAFLSTTSVQPSSRAASR